MRLREQGMVVLGMRGQAMALDNQAWPWYTVYARLERG